MEPATRVVPDLLTAALMCARDECPPEEHMQLCRMQEDDDDGDGCTRCWVLYLFWAANAGGYDGYRRNRLYEGGMIG